MEAEGLAAFGRHFPLRVRLLDRGDQRADDEHADDPHEHGHDDRYEGHIGHRIHEEDVVRWLVVDRHADAPPGQAGVHRARYRPRAQQVPAAAPARFRVRRGKDARDTGHVHGAECQREHHRPGGRAAEIAEDVAQGKARHAEVEQFKPGQRQDDHEGVGAARVELQFLSQLGGHF